MKRSKSLCTINLVSYPSQFLPTNSGEQAKIGSWGGSGQIDDKNVITFENIPEGKYVIYGRPNPGSNDQKTDSKTVDLKGGKTAEVTLNAR